MSQIASLLVILDKLALVATFNKAKLAPFWEIATLRQINGSFINSDHTLNTPNLAKLFSKIEPTTYHLVLPDKLFNLKMQSIPHTSAPEIADYLDTASPDSLSQHEILLQLKDKSQVQIATIKKQLLDQLFHLQTNADLVISQVMPLSWLVKPIIGLEPALSLIHIEDKIYLAQHYLGLEKTTELDPADPTALLAHLKNLKQQEPNLQIIYLMTETRLENIFKRELKDILPTQQLAATLGGDNITPPIKAYLENAWRAIMTDSSLLMSFTPASYAEYAAIIDESTPKSEPATTTPTVASEPDIEEIEEDIEEEITEESEPIAADPDATPPTPPTTITLGSDDLPSTATASLIKSLPDDDDDEDNDFNQTLADVVAKQKIMIDHQDGAPSSSPAMVATVAIPSSEDKKEIKKSTDTTLSSDEIDHKKSVHSTVSAPSSSPASPSVKKSLRPLWIALIIIVTTVALGCALGFILLKVLNSSVADAPAPTPSASATPTPVVSTSTASPSASVSAQVEEKEEFNPAKYSILVVNATGVSGLAANTKAKLDAAGYKEIVTGNAAGDYDAAGDYEDMEGDLVLLKTPNLELVSNLKKDSGLELSHDTNKENYQAEDAVSKYDAVIVLRLSE